MMYRAIRDADGTATSLAGRDSTVPWCYEA